jgi:Protein of unknown function (DUF2750)
VTVSAAQADAFYLEVAQDRCVWTIQDEGGIPAPMDSHSGQRCMPFWSKRSRAQRVIDTLPAYAGFRADLKIELNVWFERWLPGLEQDGMLIGVNWSGKRATGYDMSSADMLRNLTARMRLGA